MSIMPYNSGQISDGQSFVERSAGGKRRSDAESTAPVSKISRKEMLEFNAARKQAAELKSKAVTQLAGFNSLKTYATYIAVSLLFLGMKGFLEKRDPAQMREILHEVQKELKDARYQEYKSQSRQLTLAERQSLKNPWLTSDDKAQLAQKYEEEAEALLDFYFPRPVDFTSTSIEQQDESGYMDTLLSYCPELVLSAFIFRQKYLSEKVSAEIAKQSSIVALNEANLQKIIAERLLEESNHENLACRADLTPEEKEFIAAFEEKWRTEQAQFNQKFEATLNRQKGRIESILEKIMGRFSGEVAPQPEKRFAHYDPTSVQAKEAAHLTEKLQAQAKAYLESKHTLGHKTIIEKVGFVVSTAFNVASTSFFLGSFGLGKIGACAYEAAKIAGTSRMEKVHNAERCKEAAYTATTTEATVEAARRTRDNTAYKSRYFEKKFGIDAPKEISWPQDKGHLPQDKGYLPMTDKQLRAVCREFEEILDEACKVEPEIQTT